MSWAAPVVLWGLLGPALAAVMLLVLAFLRRHRPWSRWPGIVRVVAVGRRVHPVSVAHGTRRPWLLLLALSCALAALAGPRWGTVDEPVFQKSREVMLALDLSRSMLAQDVPPSRLERARLLARSLLDGLRGERVGLVVFAGTAFVQVPMSADYQILEEFLPALNPEYMPQGGTDYDGMLRSALGGFSAGSDTDRYLVVLSDGEAADDRWRERLAPLKEKGVHVIALGVGTTAGGFIPDAKTGGYLKDARGAVVLSRLEPATLQALAYESGGAYRDASAWVDLAAVLRETVERGRQGQFTDRRAARAIERFQWFLAPALLFTLLGVWREIPARPRVRHVRKPAARSPAAVATGAALALALAAFAVTGARAAVVDTTPADPVERLRSTVARLSASGSVAPAGWKAMAEHTLAAAEALQSSKQPLPPGVVHDALAAVDRGEALDPRAADWPALREQLRRLLEPPPEPQPEEKPEEKKEDKPSDQQQQQQQSQSDSRVQPGQQPEREDEQQQKEDKSQPSEQQPQTQQQSGEPAPGPKQQPKQGAGIGELKAPPGEAPPPGEPPPKTRTFGGQQADTPPPTDPQLAAALARLRELSERDSPAVIHQRLQEEEAGPAPALRDW